MMGCDRCDAVSGCAFGGAEHDRSAFIQAVRGIFAVPAEGRMHGVFAFSEHHHDSFPLFRRVVRCSSSRA